MKWNYRFIGGVTECADLTCYADTGDGTQYIDDPDYHRAVDESHVVDLVASYGFDAGFGTATFMLGVNTVMAATPPPIYQGFYADSDPDYDFLGRYVYVRLVQSL